ncbi:uncharacterized protein LOC110705418 [Chenopodium quinoa]|uniref:uncharacterized protein LOC110705418 n=1 Tax=Chenopodium quinoa TaxID=63459 RepID=UPI000B78AC6E|nr:uncharacterized protein LOC110705418 [Chenopodium quinoa]
MAAEFQTRTSYERTTNNLQLDLYHGGGKNTWNDRRSYTLDHHNNDDIYNNNHNVYENQFDNKLKKSKTFSNSKVWCFSDPEFKRKKRVASYRAYTVEGKVKGSFKRSFNWLKEKLLYGFW